MKIKDNTQSHFALFFFGILAGILCRLSDFFPYESLWSFPSIATLFGFWIASVGIITCCSASNRGAFLHTFLYMFGMTLSFYGLKSILGVFLAQFSGEFPTRLFLAYSAISLICGIGSGILYFWNKKTTFGSVLCALPAAGMLAEAIGCLIVLLTRRMLLGQTLFDFAFAAVFGILLYRKANYKVLYFVTLTITAALVFWMIYRPFLL